MIAGVQRWRGQGGLCGCDDGVESEMKLLLPLACVCVCVLGRLDSVSCQRVFAESKVCLRIAGSVKEAHIAVTGSLIAIIRQKFT